MLKENGVNLVKSLRASMAGLNSIKTGDYLDRGIRHHKDFKRAFLIIIDPFVSTIPMSK